MWLLMISLAVNGQLVSMAEFPTAAKCQEAGKEIVEQTPEYKYVCVEE